MFYAVEKITGSTCRMDDDETLYCFETKRFRDMWISNAKYAGYAPWITCEREAVPAKEAKSRASVDDYGDRYCINGMERGVVYL